MGDMSRCRHGSYVGYCEACNPKQHIYPVEDLKPHDLTETCWCHPCVEDDLVIHNSMDERETYEQGRRIMATDEGKVKARVKDLLKAYEAYWHCPVQNGMGAPSLDFVGCSKGRYFAVETKAESKGMTPRQELTATAIKKAGGKVFLINETSGMDELKEWITDETE